MPSPGLCWAEYQRNTFQKVPLKTLQGIQKQHRGASERMQQGCQRLAAECGDKALVSKGREVNW